VVCAVSSSMLTYRTKGVIVDGHNELSPEQVRLLQIRQVHLPPDPVDRRAQFVRSALHEAGHATVAHLQARWTRLCTISPRRLLLWQRGLVQADMVGSDHQISAEDARLWWDKPEDERIVDDMAFYLAGQCVEIWFTGYAVDLENDRKIATERLVDFLDLHPPSRHEKTIRAYMERGERRAWKLVREHVLPISLFAGELLRRKTIEGYDVRTTMDDCLARAESEPDPDLVVISQFRRLMEVDCEPWIAHLFDDTRPY
jgi:hypothetical protein